MTGGNARSLNDRALSASAGRPRHSGCRGRAGANAPGPASVLKIDMVAQCPAQRDGPQEPAAQMGTGQMGTGMNSTRRLLATVSLAALAGSAGLAG